MNDLMATVAVILGVTLALLSAVGIVRMPDVYMRLQVATKASSLGIGLLMLGVAVHFGEVDVVVRAILVVVFIFLTAPVSAHLIGRAAYMAGDPLSPDSQLDELAGEYDLSSGRLASPSAVAVPGTEPHEPSRAMPGPGEG